MWEDNSFSWISTCTQAPSSLATIAKTDCFWRGPLHGQPLVLHWSLLLQVHGRAQLQISLPLCCAWGNPFWQNSKTNKTPRGQQETHKHSMAHHCPLSCRLKFYFKKRNHLMNFISRLGQNFKQILSVSVSFCDMYFYEAAFSTLTIIKSKYWSTLQPWRRSRPCSVSGEMTDTHLIRMQTCFHACRCKHHVYTRALI